MKQLFKKFSITFLILLVAVRLSLPVVVLAQEVTPTDTPVPTPTVTTDQTTVDNNATVDNATTSNANTGDNGVNATPTPTDSPTPTQDTISPTPTDNPTPTQAPLLSPDPNATDSSTVSASNAADLTNNTTTTSNTGANNVTTTGNNASQPESTPTPTPEQQVKVQTGDAVSVVAGSNTINTTSVNSDMTDQTINIFGDQTGNIDLSTLFQLVQNIITNDTNNDPVINVQVTGVNNYAYLSNTAVSTANTGGNTANGDNVVVTTGNAESVVSLINKVNLTVVNSSIHLVSINIFGHLTGNIILPNLTPYQSSTCTMCGVTFNTQNQAVVNNNVTSDANTGANSLTASSDATLTTGNAYSETNTVNVVNQTVLGMIFENLFINEFGNWNGSFLGWDSFGPTGSGDLALSSGLSATTGGTNSSGSISSTNINNTAYVNNSIYSGANTGTNTVNGQHVQVTTGDAYSAVSLINFINSSFFKTFGFFGFINIFGKWDGNIGGADKFVTPTPTPSDGGENIVTNQKEDGGALSVENINNVGAYIYPGDTVTFFIKTKNIGTGKVYGAKLHLYLLHNGQNVGGTTFNLGDIPGGRGVKVTTGLVISKDADAGAYIARADVTGTTGEEDTQVSATADSTFTIAGETITANTQTNPPIAHPQSPKAVLGTSTNHNSNTDQQLYWVLLGVLIAYVLVRILRAKEQFILLFSPKLGMKSRLNLLRLFLL